MTLSETYDKMGGDYKDVIGRFYSADLVERFLKKFPDDQSYSSLCEAFAQNDVKTAFCAAHTLKGICQNLAIANLAQPLCTMTELLRAERLEEARVLLPRGADPVWHHGRGHPGIQRTPGNVKQNPERFPNKEDRTDAPWRHSRKRPFFVGVCVQSGEKPALHGLQTESNFSIKL